MLKSIKILLASCLVVVSLFIFASNNLAIAQNSVPEKDMLLVFDASGSMTEQFGGVSRIDALKGAVNGLMDTLDANVLAGLRPFAHIKRATEAEACIETTLAQAFTTERSIIKTQTALLQAVGSYTPLAYTLTTSAADFKVGNDNILILLTDGKDTCGGDPVKAAGELFNSAKKIKIYVVGMGVDATAKAQLSLIASTGGGVYYDASNSASLTASLNAIKALEQPKERLVNLTPIGGKEVVGGNDFTSAESISSYDYRLKDSLAPGQYAYFVYQIGYSSTIKVSLTLYGDRMGVTYSSSTNSFEESNLHNYRIEFFDEKAFPSATPIEVKDASMFRQSYNIKREDCTPGLLCYFRVGSKDFAISKYDTFKFERTDTPVTPVTSGGSAQGGAVNKSTSASTNSSSTTLIYILSGIIGILLVLVVIAIFVVIKKRSNSGGDISTPASPMSPPPTSN